MQLFDTLSQSKVEIEGKNGQKEFRMFVCGPTVQDNVHLGHAKTYLAFDIAARWLLRSGRKVFFLLNITDVDDKIFDRAKKEGVPYMAIADRFFGEFLKDLDSLNIVTISKFARVSNYVEESASLVRRLLDSGKAYSLNNNVYFDTSKAYNFGKLSHQSPHDLRMKQIDAAPGKKNTVDFLLWRVVPEATEGVWNTSVGLGRPGWHIQDTAIAFEEFGGPYDLHGGATELIFPHHEAELAQDEAISNEVPFVKTWMHTGLFYKGSEKMSKSLGNVVTIGEALKKHSPDEIRYYFLKHHYRDAFDYSASDMDEAASEFRATLKKTAIKIPKSEITGRSSADAKGKEFLEKWNDFASAMDDDLDTPKAIEIALGLARTINEGQFAVESRNDLGLVFWDMAESLGFQMS